MGEDNGQEVAKLREEIAKSQEKAAKLEEENTQLKKSLDYSDQKIQAVVKFGAHQDNAVSHQFKACKDGVNRHQIESEINRTIQSADYAVITLCEKLPGLEDLVTEHEGNKV